MRTTVRSLHIQRGEDPRVAGDTISQHRFYQATLTLGLSISCGDTERSSGRIFGFGPTRLSRTALAPEPNGSYRMAPSQCLTTSVCLRGAASASSHNGQPTQLRSTSARLLVHPAVRATGSTGHEALDARFGIERLPCPMPNRMLAPIAKPRLYQMPLLCTS